MPEVPFGTRLFALVALLALVACGELLLRGPRRATRWREYAALLAAGLVGGAFGAAVDQLSVTLSPDYFELGKGIAPGPGLRARVAALGLQAGITAGLIAGGVLLAARGHGPSAPTLAATARATPAVLLGALAGGPLGAVTLGPLDPLGLRAELGPLLSDPARVRAFCWVWGLHAGVYAGAALGLGVAAWRVRRSRRGSADAA